MSRKKFKFSVVVPIYNVEAYLRETIESVLNQDIGFEDHVQLILVNDGSPDRCGEICREYQKRYPENIIYVEQENAGVSAARNRGMEYVEGKYVNFLDSDDKWSLDAFSKVYKFFEQHAHEIHLVSCKQEFFEAQTGLHILSKEKYAGGDRVIDIFNHFQELQLHVTASFVKASAMRLSQFDPAMKYGEDALYVTELILDTHKYGIVAEPTHYYRKRANNSSALQGKETSLDWYFVTPKLFYRRLMEISMEKWGIVIPYIQYLTCYDMQWRLKDRIEMVLGEGEQKQYIDSIYALLQECEDDIILMQKSIDFRRKLFLLSLKYGEDVLGQLVYMDAKLLWKNIVAYNLYSGWIFPIDILKVEGGRLFLSGQVSYPFGESMRFWIQDEVGNFYPIQLCYSTHKKDEVWGCKLGDTYVYDLCLPLQDKGSFEILASYKDAYPIRLRLVFGKFAKMGMEFEHSYFVQDGIAITHQRSCICYIKSTAALEKQLENALREEWKEKLDTGDLEPSVRELMKEGVEYRKKYFRRKLFVRRKIWLISDRIHVAGDSGEALFKYLMQHKDKEICPYFVISEQSDDFARIKRIGRVIPYGSKKHKLYTLLADKIISSQGEDNIFNPFYAAKKYVENLFHYDFVFLQHGITKDDISKWLNKYNKNIALFVTTAQNEYQSVLEGNYHYDKSVVKLTGLPRFDYLVQSLPSQKRIVFMPTWRTELAIEMDPETGERPYNQKFKDSEYYRFYQRLIHDERIVEVLKRNGYQGKFCVHPNNMANISDFSGNDAVTVCDAKIDYQKEFLENALLITDYSSVFFDFAYLKKRIIYVQTDRESFFAGQIYEQGYWDYETMGFGPVCLDYESTVDAIVRAVEQDCVVEDVYRKRMEDFYYKFDQNNCKRVYEAIKAIGGNRKRYEENV